MHSKVAIIVQKIYPQRENITAWCKGNEIYSIFFFLAGNQNNKEPPFLRSSTMQT
jgi:hypothetical protein